MIAGEYSVLGPAGEALAMAVAPGLEVFYEPCDEWVLERADTGAVWRSGQPVPADLRFVQAALQTTRAVLDVAPQHITTAVPASTGTGVRKPGVGGSASATVAVVGALFHASGRRPLDCDAITDLAVRAHVSAQGGRGSGYDIATIAHGGLVRWRPQQVAGAVGGGDAAQIAWPDGLVAIAGYTGKSASTTGLIEALAEIVERDRAAAARALIALSRPVGALIDAFEQGALHTILAGVDACHAALVQWDRIGVITDEVADMIALAVKQGAHAKVSGAGGGDSVLAFANDPTVIEHTKAAWRAAGYEPLPFQFSPLGVREKNASSEA